MIIDAVKGILKHRIAGTILQIAMDQFIKINNGK